MKVTRRAATLGGISVLSRLVCGAGARADDGFVPLEGVEDFILASDAYVFGYPLVTMEMTRRVNINVAEPVGTRAPMGRLANMRAYPTTAVRDVPAPNADTLYTTGFLMSARSLGS